MPHRNVYFLHGLSCANCAEDIEKEINALPEVQKAILNFPTKRLTLYAVSENGTKLDENVRHIIHSHEPAITISNQTASPAKPSYNAKTVRTIIGAGLFAAALSGLAPASWSVWGYMAAYLLAGGDILIKAARNLLRGRVFDENSLMSIATLGAFAIGEYPEGAAVMLFFKVGEFFQDLAVEGSRHSISALMDIRPDTATVRRGAETVRVPVEQVAIGDEVLVKPGERIPVDGAVIEGNSAVDTSALTGESLPRAVREGSAVLSGTINKGSLLRVHADKRAEESTAAKILNLVNEAAENKAPMESFITKFARVYTPIVVSLAVLLTVIPVLFGGSISTWVYRSLVFLIISCPCALVVSIPLSFFGGIGRASRSGVLIKGGSYLEALSRVSHVILDKTGTLTTGQFRVTGIETETGFSSDELLEAAAHVEGLSNHPLGSAVRQAYPHQLDLARVASQEEMAGQGIRATFDGRRVLVGSERLLTEQGVNVPNRNHSQTVLHVAFDDLYAGHILAADTVRPEAKEALRGLKERGASLTLLTGDNRDAAEAVGNLLGIADVAADALPHDKLNAVHERSRGHGTTVFVGDGINDAPVLAAADIGIAMGGLGSDAAIEAADIVLMTDDLSKLVEAIDLAAFTRRVVYQNIVLALGVKLVFLALGGLGIASLWEAVSADVGVTLLTVLNAIRVLRWGGNTQMLSNTGKQQAYSDEF